MILSYAHPTPRKKISVASLQLGMSADADFRPIQGIDILNVVLPKIYSKFVAGRPTFSFYLCPIAFTVLIY